MECELFQVHDLSPIGSSQPTVALVLGHVKLIHVRKDILNEREVVDPAKFRAISRLGGLTYARVGEGFDLPRDRWSEISEEAQRAGSTIIDFRTWVKTKSLEDERMNAARTVPNRADYLGSLS